MGGYCGGGLSHILTHLVDKKITSKHDFTIDTHSPRERVAQAEVCQIMQCKQ